MFCFSLWTEKVVLTQGMLLVCADLTITHCQAPCVWRPNLNLQTVLYFSLKEPLAYEPKGYLYIKVKWLLLCQHKGAIGMPT